jgi:predicted Zn-dependent protease
MCTSCPPGLAVFGSLTRRRTLRGLAALSYVPALAGCERIAPLLVSEEEVQRLGLAAWAQVEARMQPSRDPAMHRLVERVAARVLSAAGENPGTWEIRAFAEPGINAFVLPGRKIGILEGMARIAGGEAGLAAVIGFSREIAALLGVGAEFGLARPYGRAQELEADRIGVSIMAEAGYDPRAAIQLWQRMDQVSGSGVPAILSTHPAPQARIRALEALIPQTARAS